MAELEIHTEVEGGDPMGKRVGVLAAVLAVLLAVVTIMSHRAHTDAVLLKSTANDDWSFYQAKKIKFHNLELGEDLLRAMPANADTAKALPRYASEKGRYAKEYAAAEETARHHEEEAEKVEHRALRYDLGEGLLEIGMVLTSLYFIARRTLFPIVGVTSAIIGTVTAITGYFL